MVVNMYRRLYGMDVGSHNPSRPVVGSTYINNIKNQIQNPTRPAIQSTFTPTTTTIATGASSKPNTSTITSTTDQFQNQNALTHAEYLKLSAIVDVETDSAAKATLKSMQRWHQLILNIVGVIVLEVVIVIATAYSKYEAFINSYDEAIAFGVAAGSEALITLPTSAHGVNIALCSLYPWYNELLFGEFRAFPEACVTSFYSVKFGPCLRKSPGVAAIFYATMWEASFEGKQIGQGDGAVSVQEVLCTTFYKCDKVACAPKCHPNTVPDTFSGTILPSIQGGISMGTNGTFIGGPAGFVVGAAVGASLSYAQASIQNQNDVATCNFNVQYTQCYAGKDDKLCGAAATCGELGLPACTDIECLSQPSMTMSNISCDQSTKDVCASREFILPPGTSVGCNV